jgi:dsRNA-specific ribonuclease
LKEHEFELYFSLPAGDIDDVIERLAEKCNDAIVGSGVPGRISLEFIREELDRDTAIKSAIGDVLEAILGAILIETRPAAA